MEFTTIPCHESLRPFIRNYWMLTAYCTAAGTQQVFSNGATALLHVHPKVKDDFSPNDLAATACLSQKQFTRVFKKYVGMNPKTYLRLLRFHKALQELQKSENSPIGSIALSCGYTDLAHMSKDFIDICGYSPSELVRQAEELTETFGSKFSGLMKKKIKIENMV